MDIGRAIREIATERGMKQVDICRLTGMSDAHMSQIWNSKKYDPSASALFRISVALDVDANTVMSLAERYQHPKDKPQQSPPKQ
ncbi:helix-turn-helix domain-containing protein [Olsenella phocaeensis]|uniref:helix-turn-helix domain-containing protein n=1 Tax=Olsenella phocaeensis TaxID=1852385 RepID=UPI0009304459|nr:helix-turn-helix domain-containing protein [Olsenella phocaeensis]